MEDIHKNGEIKEFQVVITNEKEEFNLTIPKDQFYADVIIREQPTYVYLSAATSVGWGPATLVVIHDDNIPGNSTIVLSV